MSMGYFAAAFDLLNVRDLDLIQQATRSCEHLVVGVFSDELVEQRLGRQPVVPGAERVRLVHRVKGVAGCVTHREWPDDHEAIRFALREDADLVGPGPVVILESGRESGSEILRAALAPGLLRAVA